MQAGRRAHNISLGLALPRTFYGTLTSFSIRLVRFDVNLLFQILFIFLQQRRVSWRTIDLAGFILPFIKLLLRPFIVDMSDLRLLDDLRQQVRRNEVDTLPI